MKRVALLLLLLLAPPSFAEENGQIALEGATDALEVITSAAGSIDYHVTWSNVTATALTTPGTGNGNITTAATTSLIAAPAASNWRYLRSLHLYNASTTVTNTVTVQIDRSTANRVLCKASLAPGEALDVEASGGCLLFDSAGRRRVSTTETTGFNGRTIYFSKVATATDASGYHYMHAKDTGFPGAYTLGAPGLSGANFTCDTGAGAAVAGAPVLPNATGGWYLTRFGVTSPAVNTYELIDLVWYNTGIGITTTTGQTVNSVAFPARDLNGATSGEGYRIAIYVSAAAGLAATASNATVTYTNSSGTGSRTATLSASVGFQAPATPVIGTWIPFLLQAGDTGVQSIQTLTLGTTWVSGTINLMVYRPLADEGVPTANGSSGSLHNRQSINPGVRIWNGSCLNLSVIGSSATTAPSVFGGVVELMDR